MDTARFLPTIHFFIKKKKKKSYSVCNICIIHGIYIKKMQPTKASKVRCTIARSLTNVKLGPHSI